MVLFYPEAKSESCFKSICEFTLVVTNSRSMSFKHDAGSVYDVELQQNGTLSLATNRFHLEVPNITLSPDMVHTADGTKARNIILVNDRFPGPTLEIMEGSEISVKVINQLQFEGISIHWHGIHLLNNVWMDGVPYLTQCPILPRQSFMYRFRANPGTHFYHSHNELQRLDGLFGCLENAYTYTRTRTRVHVHAYMENAYMENAYMENAYMENAYMENAYMESAYMENAYMENAYMENAYMENAYMENAYMENAYMENAYMENAYNVHL